MHSAPLPSVIDITSLGDGLQCWMLPMPEGEGNLRQILAAHPHMLALADIIRHPSTRLHWLASRALLAMVLEERAMDYYKDDFGRPCLTDGTHISLSHCRAGAALALSPIHPIGLDLEMAGGKADKLAPKFLNTAEMAFAKATPGLDATVMWSAKEAVYKWYGRKRVLFAQHMALSVLAIQEGQVSFRCHFSAAHPNCTVDVLARMVAPNVWLAAACGPQPLEWGHVTP